METTWIFRASKLHPKNRWKRRGNSSKLSLRRIDVISNRCRFDVECPLERFLKICLFFQSWGKQVIYQMSTIHNESRCFTKNQSISVLNSKYCSSGLRTWSRYKITNNLRFQMIRTDWWLSGDWDSILSMPYLGTLGKYEDDFKIIPDSFSIMMFFLYIHWTCCSSSLLFNWHWISLSC